MSQAKVDRYKEEKANRQKIMAKQKMEKTLWKVGGSVVALVLVAWIGFSAFNKFYVPPRKVYEVNTTAMDEYLNTLAEES